MRYMSLALAVLVGGCAGGVHTPTAPSIPAEAVVRQIKKELAQYEVYRQEKFLEEQKVRVARSSVCAGNVDFKITSVTVSLNAQADATSAGNAGLNIPVGGPGTLGPSLDVSYENKQSQKIDFTLYPAFDKPDRLFAPEDSKELFTGTPIADGLKAFRQSLLKTSDQPPCVTFDPPPSAHGKEQNNSITYAFTIVQSLKGGLSFKFLLFSVGASQKLEQLSANTITVHFEAVPGAQTFK